jgi:hypothetical protein
MSPTETDRRVDGIQIGAQLERQAPVDYRERISVDSIDDNSRAFVIYKNGAHKKF